jgi:hypothetical protein
MTQQHVSKPHITEGRPPGIEQPDETDNISVGNICHVLQNERRRLALYQLRNAEEPLRTGDLAEEVAAIENDTTPEQLSHSERKRVYISLYQVHLPTLDEAGVIAYDSDRGTIETLPTAHKLYEALDRLVDVTVSTGESASDSSESPPDKMRTVGVLVATVGIVLGALVGFGVASGTPGQILPSTFAPVVLASSWFPRGS